MLYKFIILCIINFSVGNHIKGLDDSILFRVTYPGFHRDLLETSDYDIFEVSTPSKEKFKCLVPRSYGENENGFLRYSGPNPLNLLMLLFKKQTCTIRHESFWSYEICHGLHIKQYHEEREGKTARHQEYTLGTVSLEDLQNKAQILDEELLLNPNPEVDVVRVEGINVPYFEVKYTDGSVCDLTGKPRTSRVLYVCFEDGRHIIYSVKEIFSCEYEVIVLSQLLCEHPSYRPNDVPQTDLPCVSMSEGIKRPKEYVKIETESLKLRTHGTVLTGDLSGGSVKLEIVDVKEPEDLEVDEDGFKVTELLSDSAERNQVKAPMQDTFPPQPSIDKKLVEDFLNGIHCLEGGYGWWKFKFCYGKMVQQFHQESDGTKFVILLGTFDIEKHRQWIDQNPAKKFAPGRTQVSHFYSSGDLCESEKVQKLRQVEVKLKCKPTLSPNAVSLYLLEPNICEYVLAVETSLVCPLLRNADELGLFTRMLSTGNDDLEAKDTEDYINLVVKNVGDLPGDYELKIVEEKEESHSREGSAQPEGESEKEDL